jgi:pyruvate carboxylase
VNVVFKKVLVANRGEIAIRALRAAYELGARTVAVFPYEDRNSVHRLKADESYQIGERGHPVRAYLSVPEIVNAARTAGGDLALALVGNGVSVDEFAQNPGGYDIPDSVIGFLRGELGTPVGGSPEPFRTRALHGRINARAVAELSAADEAGLEGTSPQRQETLNRLLFPGPTKEFLAHRQKYGNTSLLSTNQFFYGLSPGEEHHVQLEPGVELLIGLEAVSEPDERGMRTVMCLLNGQLRPVAVRDRSIAAKIPPAEKADRCDPGHIPAPFAGVVTLAVKEGDKVTAGDTVATIEAMKMEAAITTPRGGTVTRLAIGNVQQVEGGDLLAVVAAAQETSLE